MLSPEAVLLMANGFFTVKLARGSRRTAPGRSKDSFAAVLPNFPHPFTKGESHVVTLAQSPTNSFSCGILQASLLPAQPLQMPQGKQQAAAAPALPALRAHQQDRWWARGGTRIAQEWDPKEPVWDLTQIPEGFAPH